MWCLIIRWTCGHRWLYAPVGMRSTGVYIACPSCPRRRRIAGASINWVPGEHSDRARELPEAEWQQIMAS